MKPVPPTPGFFALLFDQEDHFYLLHLVVAQSSSRLGGFVAFIVGSMSVGWGWRLDGRGWIALLVFNLGIFFSLFLVHVLGSPARGGHHSFGEEISKLFDDEAEEEGGGGGLAPADLSEEVRKGQRAYRMSPCWLHDISTISNLVRFRSLLRPLIAGVQAPQLLRFSHSGPTNR